MIEEEFVAVVNIWSDMIDIQQKKVRMNNRPLNRTISSDFDRPKLGFKSACCIQNIHLGLSGLNEGYLCIVPSRIF